MPPRAAATALFENWRLALLQDSLDIRPELRKTRPRARGLLYIHRNTNPLFLFVSDSTYVQWQESTIHNQLLDMLRLVVWAGLGVNIWTLFRKKRGRRMCETFCNNNAAIATVERTELDPHAYYSYTHMISRFLHSVFPSFPAPGFFGYVFSVASGVRDAEPFRLDGPHQPAGQD